MILPIKKLKKKKKKEEEEEENVVFQDFSEYKLSF